MNWCGHVLRGKDGLVLKRALEFGFDDHRNKTRPKLTWKKSVGEESVMVGLSRKDALCQSKWIVGIDQIAIWLR